MDTARSEVPSDAAMYTVGTNLLVDVGVPSTTDTSYKESAENRASTKHRDSRTAPRPCQRNTYPGSCRGRPFSNPRVADTVTKKELVAAGGPVPWGLDASREPSDDSTIGPDGLMQGSP
jgi:hypothetical protein